MGVKPPPEKHLSFLAPGLLAACAALWVGPEPWRPLGLGLGAVLAAWAATRPVVRAAPATWHVALGGLLVTSCLALYPSIDLSLSLPRLHGVVLGVATLGCGLHWLNEVDRLRRAGTLLTLLLAGVVVTGMLLTEWPSGGEKGLPLLTRISERIDWLSMSLPLAPERGVNPNKLAAPLAMLLPPVAASALFARGRWSRLFGGGVAVLAVLLLLLTQSRSAYLAVGGGLIVLLVCVSCPREGRARSRLRLWVVRHPSPVCVSCPREGLSRFRGHAIWKMRNPDLAAYSRRFVLPLLPLMLFAVGLAWWGFGPDGVLPEGPVASPLGTNPIEIRPALEDGRRAAGLSLEFRRQVWGLAGEMVRDFPFTGIGLGTFPRVAEVLYGSALLYGPEVELPHAHNLVLQVAVDLGLPGLGFFTLLTACGTLAAHRAIAGAPSAPMRALAAGAAGGLLAYYVYGITDAIGLGEKPGLVYWILLAIVGACARLAVPRDAVPRGSISSSVEPVRSSAS